MNAGRNVTILCYAPQRNRQGADLAAVLTARGHRVSLYQLSDGGIRETPIEHKSVHIGLPGILARTSSITRIPHLQGAWRRMQFVVRPWHDACDVVFAVNYHALLPAAVIARRRHAKLVYYALELYDEPRTLRRERDLCTRYVNAIWGVEGNRMALLRDGLSRPVPGFLVYNAPRAGIGTEPRGSLREYLRVTHGVVPDDRLVVYSGSHQKYSCLEALVSGSAEWDPSLRLVLMLTGQVGNDLRLLIRANQPRVCLVPPVSHSGLLFWLRDADVGLLPYEDAEDANVRYCSPQKMFDYLACGVPFVGSRRPLIEEVAHTTSSGVCVDMSDPYALSHVLHDLIRDRPRLAEMAANARAAYEHQYNYEALVGPALEALLD